MSNPAWVLEFFCMAINIFGYGSLLNETSRRRTFTELSMVEDVVLFGYQRILNATHDALDYVAMHLIENANMKVKGHVFSVCESEFTALKERELGYVLMDVSSKLSVSFDEPVFAFVMLESNCAGKCLKHEYLNTCLGGVPNHEHDTWLKETVIPDELSK